MKRLLAILVILLAAGIGCEDPPSATVRSGTVAFPNVIGTQWTYFWVDSLTGTIDTVVVRVDASEQYRGHSARLWRARFRHSVDTLGALRVDTLHIVAAGDTVLAYRSAPPNLMSLQYPFEVGKAWTSGAGLADSTVVAELLPTYGLPVGLLNDVFRIRRQYTLADSVSEQSDLYLAAGRGLVQMTFLMVDLHAQPDTIVNEQWVLMDFDAAD